MFGQFFTSIRIADYIVSNVGLTETTTIVDISCGDGSFLLSCYDYLEKKQISPQKIFSNIYGIDIHKKSLEYAKNNLSKRSTKNFKSILEKNILHGDTISLKSETILEKFPKIQKTGGFDGG